MASVLLGSTSPGRVIKIKESDGVYDYIVLIHGYPAAGRTLVMANNARKGPGFNGTGTNPKNDNTYEGGTGDTWLNTEFFNGLDSAIRNQIAEVPILQYKNGLASNPRTLYRKVFALSYPEVVQSASTSGHKDGTWIPYFDSAEKRAGHGTWWTRSPNTNSTNIIGVNNRGGIYSESTNTWNPLPAFTLPSTMYVMDDGSVTTNTAPTVPGAMTIPSSISGGSTITVKWGASTDAQNNLAGYKVERSTNGGSSWSQIYQGTAVQTTNLVAFGTASVMYRVKAYDEEGAESGYRTSSQVTVVNNRAPGAPPAISVPNTVKGGASLTVSWSAATDSDGNLSGYILERCINGGTSWTQIYKGSALKYTDTITKGWTKVKYRVQSYDAYNAVSAYTTSAERTVENNTAPTITCSSADGANLGTKSSGFSVTYSVNDVDTADPLTVTEKMDNVVKRTFTAMRGTNNSFSVTGEYFQKLLNGQHTMVISVSDGKVTVTRTLRFTKSVTSCRITLANPLEADAQIKKAVMSITRNLPADAEFQVLVTNNANDPTPVWEDITRALEANLNFLFTNQTAARGFAFNFIVTARRGPSGTGGSISSIGGAFE